MELLKLSTLLIEFLGRELVEHRKELIKFAWNHLKSEENTSKQTRRQAHAYQAHKFRRTGETSVKWMRGGFEFGRSRNTHLSNAGCKTTQLDGPDLLVAE